MPKLSPSVGSAEQVALQAGRREQDVVRVVEAAFDQHEPRADRFRDLRSPAAAAAPRRTSRQTARPISRSQREIHSRSQ